MAGSNTIFGLLLGWFLMGFYTASAYDFYVGGRAGWVQNPPESYNQWASRMRFQINDKLVFKYKKGDDSVLVVNTEHFDSCNMSNPLQKLDGGDSVFLFDRSGPFHFISGVPGRCANGEKMLSVVMADRRKKTPPTPPPASSMPPTGSPVPSPISPPSTSPVSSPPSTSPFPSPISPPSTSPVSPPSTSPASTPSLVPSMAPPSSDSPTSPPAGSGPGNGKEGPPAPSPKTPSSSSSVLRVSSVSFGMLVLVLGNVIFS